MKQIKHWYWRYWSPVEGKRCTSLLPMTARDAASYSGAQRIPGTMQLLDVDEDAGFKDTVPGQAKGFEKTGPGGGELVEDTTPRDLQPFPGRSQ